MNTPSLKPLNAALAAQALKAKLPAGFKIGRDRKERIVQFGEGGFLRGFVDWMIDRLNTKGLYDGSVVIVQPLAQGMVPVLNAQDGLYTQLLRGVQQGKVVEERTLVSSVSRGVVPHTQFDDYIAIARNPDLRIVVSNTTEAGIACSPDDRLTDQPPVSFPAKLTQFLLERYRAFDGAPDKGLVMLPCELIEFNGKNLRRCVLETAAKWQLEASVVKWIEDCNIFCNTLVDRIVTGYPAAEAPSLWAELGYEDKLLNTGEIFHAWVIEGPASLADELPFAKAGLDVTFTPDYKPYRDRKVRILNGAHTMTVLAAYLAGKDMVKECMDDPVISKYLARGLAEEIIPTLDLPKADLDSFAAAVSERFSNPYVKHALLSISLNSTSKFTARVLPSLKTFHARRGAWPKRLSFALAALLAFYRGTEIRDGALIGKRAAGNEYKIQDSPDVLAFFQKVWAQPDASASSVAQAALANRALWNEDLTALPGLEQQVGFWLDLILSEGAEAALRRIES